MTIHEFASAALDADPGDDELRWFAADIEVARGPLCEAAWDVSTSDPNEVEPVAEIKAVLGNRRWSLSLPRRLVVHELELDVSRINPWVRELLQAGRTVGTVSSGWRAERPRSSPRPTGRR